MLDSISRLACCSCYVLQFVRQASPTWSARFVMVFKYKLNDGSAALAICLFQKACIVIASAEFVVHSVYAVEERDGDRDFSQFLVSDWTAFFQTFSIFFFFVFLLSCLLSILCVSFSLSSAKI